MTGAIYVRYSPRIEQDQSFTLENQISMCRELAVKDGVLIDEKHIYQDHHISGASDHRPQFEQMLEHIWSGHFPDYLYTKDASRLSRKGLEASWLIEKIWDRGITIRYCLGDYGDPRQSADTELMHNINHVFNQHARSKKAEETRFHQKQNALAGYSNGGRPPYGYRKKQIQRKNQRNENQPKVLLELNPETAPAIKHAFQRYQDGVGANTIAGELNQMGFRSQQGKLFAKNTIRSWFRNPYPFAGCQVWGRTKKGGKVNPVEQWTIVEDNHEAIISLEQADRIFQQNQAKKAAPRNKGLRRASKYLLTGLIICPLCQSHFIVDSKPQKEQYFYICGTRNRRSQGCSNKLWIHSANFEQQLMAQIEGVILQDGPLDDYLQRCLADQQQHLEQSEQEIKSVRQQLASVDQRQDNLLNALADGLLPAQAIQQKYGAEENKKRQLSYRLQQLRESLDSGPVELPTFRELLRQELQQDEKARKDALQALIERITAYPDRKMEVKFRIGQREEKIAGGELDDPHQSTYPVPDMFQIRV